MLSLLYDTPEEWAIQALEGLPALLEDHRECELKAASTALSLARKWGEGRPALVRAMQGLAREEMAHAVMVERLQKEYGRPAARPPGHPYTQKLRRLCGHQEGRLPDLLLVCGLIEARSCERFVLLARAASGTPLAGFYEDFIAAEARHHALFVELAGDACGPDAARVRLRELALLEAEIVRELPMLPRMH